MGKWTITWPTVAALACVLAAIVALAVTGHVDAIGALVAGVGAILAAFSRQAAYVKPEQADLDARLQRYLQNESTWPPPPGEKP